MRFRLNWPPDRVRTRLLAAFLILLMAALALAVVGWIGMRSTQRALTGFESDVLPNIAQALELAERTAQLAAVAPHLAESSTLESLETNAEVFKALLDDIRRRSADVPPSSEIQVALDKLLESTDRDLSNLIVLAQNRQSVQTRLQRQMGRLEQVGSLLHRRDRESDRYDPAIAALWSSMVLGATTDSEATLGRLQADVEALLLAAKKRQAFAKFDAPFQATLVELATGSDNILALRRQQREFERGTDLLVASTRTSADQLSEQVSRHVAYLRSTAAHRSDLVKRAIWSGETGMLVLALVCLAVAAVATRYVRQLVAQIENITNVMSRLAQGDTAQSTPATNRRDELGALARAFEVFRDNLLAKQQLVSDLKTQRLLLEAVHNSMTDGLAVFDFEAKLLLWNPQLANLLGKYALPPREGVAIRELFTSFPANTTWVAPGHMEPQPLATVRTEDFSAFDHIELHLPDGEVFDLRSRAMPGGGTVTLVTDLTVRRVIEVQLQHAQKLEMLGQLTGGVTHDFNNYLGTILGNLELVENQLSPESTSRAQLQRAQRAASSAAALTRRLLAFSRRQPLQAEHVSIDRMIEEMRDLIEYSAGPQVTVSFELGAHPACVYVDRGQLENALLNLVINSAGAMPSGGVLIVGTRRHERDGADDGEVEIRVTDTGTGIPEHLLGKVFEPFFTTKSPVEGSGLGLSIVYGFVKQSGGRISLTSKLGVGTNVTVVFPTSIEPVDVSVPEVGAQTLTAVLGRQRVLLVDDDEMFRATVKDMLAPTNVTVTMADSGEAALNLLESDPDFDVVLSDICLGAEVDGIRLAHTVQQRWPSIHVALMSGLSPESFTHRDDWDATLPFLQKPFVSETLTCWLANLVSEGVATDSEPATKHRAIR